MGPYSIFDIAYAIIWLAILVKMLQSFSKIDQLKKEVSEMRSLLQENRRETSQLLSIIKSQKSQSNPSSGRSPMPLRHQAAARRIPQ